MAKEVTTIPPLRAFELWRQIKRQLCGGIQNDSFVCVPSLRIAYIRTCGSAKVAYNNTQLVHSSARFNETQCVRLHVGFCGLCGTGSNR